jgi:hypothetical protein
MVGINGNNRLVSLVVIIKRKTKNTDICSTLYFFIFQDTLWQRKLSRLSVETRDII